MQRSDQPPSPPLPPALLPVSVPLQDAGVARSAQGDDAALPNGQPLHRDPFAPDFSQARPTSGDGLRALPIASSQHAFPGVPPPRAALGQREQPLAHAPPHSGQFPPAFYETERDASASNAGAPPRSLLNAPSQHAFPGAPPSRSAQTLDRSRAHPRSNFPSRTRRRSLIQTAASRFSPRNPRRRVGITLRLTT